MAWRYCWARKASRISAAVAGPDVRVAHDVGERGFEGGDAVGLADYPGVQGERHDAAAFGGGFRVQQVELVADLLGEFVLGVAILDEDGVIVDVVG